MLWNKYFYMWLWSGEVVLFCISILYYICIRLPAWYYSGSIKKLNEALREEQVLQKAKKDIHLISGKNIEASYRKK